MREFEKKSLTLTITYVTITIPNHVIVNYNYHAKQNYDSNAMFQTRSAKYLELQSGALEVRHDFPISTKYEGIILVTPNEARQENKYIAKT